MAINFDSLPNSKGTGAFKPAAPGTYFATIEGADMKTPKDTTKKDYLNLKLKLTTVDGKSAGVVFDIISESEASLMMYKLKRFLRAIEVEFSGDFELTDVQKLCLNKEIIVDIKNEKDLKGEDRAVVDLFTNEIYYKKSEANEIFGIDTTEKEEKSVEEIIDEF
ncbi:MAG: DUF669 domain-containing protein [Clostridium sp.]|nr:DUF669 domain-containing protein [Clostridium sp.]